MVSGELCSAARLFVARFEVDDVPGLVVGCVVDGVRGLRRTRGARVLVCALSVGLGGGLSGVAFPAWGVVAASGVAVAAEGAAGEAVAGEAWTVGQAQAMARRTGRAVVIGSLTSEIELVSAKPGGGSFLRLLRRPSGFVVVICGWMWMVGCVGRLMVRGLRRLRFLRCGFLVVGLGRC